MTLYIFKSDLENFTWWEAIEQSIIRFGAKGTTTGFKTIINNVIYDNYNSNQDDLTYKVCKMGLGLEEKQNFKFELK